MPLSQIHITSNTPLGANVVSSGATFRTWALQIDTYLTHQVLIVMIIFDSSFGKKAQQWISPA